MEKTPAEICKDFKGHIKALHDELQGLYGDPARVGEPSRFAWPPDVRNAAYDALCSLTRAELIVQTQFEVLHDALGLGPLNWSGPCEHEKKKGLTTKDTKKREG